ncbi:tripartite motif-containing protein 15 [Trichosurus vulpecula]|uniref:tripartite motif-containing protein 15 n=1 Tax=Trichosurus vulpecula TaxID=9337 RepID=UPI00186B37D9|nr:tripartite motif-containing protein 15 [Trichosurus vulpecula]
MPSTPSLQTVHKGVHCPICTGLPEDPVTSPCGHIFCRSCLTPPSPMGAHPSRLCPICKEKRQPEVLQPRGWATENIKILGQIGETHCDEHGEKIYFFCENDGEFLCVLCRESSNHQAHAVVLLDEATQPYRERLRSRLEVLRVEKEEMEGTKCREDQKLQVLLTQIESKKQQVEEAFERLQQVLEGQQRRLLDQLGKLEKEIRKERDHYVATVSEETAQLGAHIKELEEKCQQPASELLKDVRMTLNRYEKGTYISPEPISPGLVRRIRDIHQKIFVLPEMMGKFSENLLLHLETNTGGITLDPQTASWNLSLSEDRKSVRYTRQKQNLPENPQRFDRLPAVLGTQGFSSGKHSWEIEVVLGDGGGCTVGVAREDMIRKGEMGLSTEEGVWAVIFSYHQCWASTSPGTDLPLSEIPHRVQVTLDYNGGHVTFSNAETQTTIFTFPASFSGKIFPFFAVWKKGSRLTLKP